MRRFANLVFIFFSAIFYCQDSLSIDKVIELALKNSDKVSIIESNFQIRNIQFENYKKSFLPQIVITAGLPYQRSIQEVLQFNGSTSLVERNYLSPSVNFTTKQILPFTGGEISLTNSISMNKDLANNRTAYSSNWANLTYSQSINGFNPYKWNTKKYVYSRKIDSIAYKQQKAQLKTEIARYYTDAYLLQVKCDLTKKNISKTQILLEQFQQKKNLGRALDMDVNQLEITISQLSQKLESDRFELNYLLETLASHIKLYAKDSLILKPIKKIEFVVDKNKLEKAFLDTNYENNARLQLLTADEKIDQVKKDGAVNFFLQLGLGINSSSNELNDLFNNPAQKQAVSVGAYIPILNWGILKNNKKIAESEKDILQKELAQTKLDLSIQAEKLYNYLLNLNVQTKISENELKMQEDLNNQLYNLLLYDKKTIYDYRNQLFEYEKSLMSYNELIINKYLLYLSFGEFFL